MKIPKLNLKRAATVTAFGAALASFGDYVHVITHTTGYPATYSFYFGPLPFWVPFLFAGASLTTYIAQELSEPLLRKFLTPKGTSSRLSTPKSWSPLQAYLFASLGFTSIYLLSGLLALPAGGPKDIVLALLALSFWKVCEGTRTGLVFGLATGFVGSAFEAFLLSQGVFWYEPTSANWSGIPTWLPWLYVGASTSIMVMRHQRPKATLLKG